MSLKQFYLCRDAILCSEFLKRLILFKDVHHIVQPPHVLFLACNEGEMTSVDFLVVNDLVTESSLDSFSIGHISKDVVFAYKHGDWHIPISDVFEMNERCLTLFADVEPVGIVVSIDLKSVFI